MTPPSGWGGARPGAGRKPNEPDPPLLRAGPLRGGFANEKQAAAAGNWLLGLLGSAAAEQRAERDGLILQRAQSEGVNQLGGFLVPAPLANAIINTRERYGVFRRFAQTMPISSDVTSVPRRISDLTSSFVAENSVIPDSSTGWDTISLAVKKLACLVKLSSELLEDAAIDIGAELAAQIAVSFAKKEDEAGFNGTGTSDFGGIRGVCTLIIDGQHTAGAVAAAAGHDTFAELDISDLSNLIAKLPSYAWANAKWFVSPYAFGAVFCRLASSAGGIQSLADTDGVIRPFFMGAPIIVTPSLPNIATTLNGKAMLLFGDLRLAATLGDRRAVTVRVARNRYIEQDQVGILGTERVDIVVYDVGDNSTPGPLVGLIGTA